MDTEGDTTAPVIPSNDSAPASGETQPATSGPSLPAPSTTAPAPVDSSSQNSNPTPPNVEGPIFHPEGPSIPPGTGPLGLERTCDGTDDDSNGVIDDVDADANGVCDCLKLATLGLHGEWGEGDVVTGWMKERFETATVALDGEPLSAERLAPFQVLLVRDVSTNNNPSLSFSVAEVEALWEWVRAGGGLMTVIGYSDATEINNVNRLLEPFGLGYASDQIVQGQGAAVPVTEWFEHPLTRGITQVGADNGYPAVGQGTTIAAQDGFDLGKAVTIGDGHVLVWGDEWITYEAEWTSDTTYQVEQFWRNSLLWLTRLTECQLPHD